VHAGASGRLALFGHASDATLTLHRFYVPTIEDGRARLERSQLRQLRIVLRLREGDELAVFDGKGSEWHARLAGSEAELLKPISSCAEPRTHLTIFQALIKPARFELVLQKGTELGVSRFVPFVAGRSVAGGERLDRWRSIVIEAAEQSGRTVIPDIAPALSFEDMVAEATREGVPFMPWENADRPKLSSIHKPSSRLALIVGPEGGFTDEEVEHARARGAVTVTLGRRILRSETAAIAAATLLLHLNGEF